MNRPLGALRTFTDSEQFGLHKQRGGKPDIIQLYDHQNNPLGCIEYHEQPHPLTPELAAFLNRDTMPLSHGVVYDSLHQPRGYFSGHKSTYLYPRRRDDYVFGAEDPHIADMLGCAAILAQYDRHIPLLTRGRANLEYVAGWLAPDGMVLSNAFCREVTSGYEAGYADFTCAEAGVAILHLLGLLSIRNNLFPGETQRRFLFGMREQPRPKPEPVRNIGLLPRIPAGKTSIYISELLNEEMKNKDKT